MTAPEIQRQVAAYLATEGGRAFLALQLRYFMADPYAARLVFVGDGVETEWVVSRSLLQDGTSRFVGDGDFSLGPGWGRPEWLLATLTSPDGSVIIELDRADLLAFLDATTNLVPFGREAQDVDAILARIFAGESA